MEVAPVPGHFWSGAPNQGALHQVLPTMSGHHSLSAGRCIQWGGVVPALPGRRCCRFTGCLRRCFGQNHIYHVAQGVSSRTANPGPCPRHLPVLSQGLLPAPPEIAGLPQLLRKKTVSLDNFLITPRMKPTLRKTNLGLAGGRPVHRMEDKKFL